MEIVTLLTLAAKAAAVPPALLLSICYTETNHRNVISPHDGNSASLGICQVKLNTARMFEHDVTEADLMDPRVNARIAAAYVGRQLKRYRGSWVCAATAYNRGSVPGGLDTNNTNCNTKYSRKVMSHLEGQSWKIKRAQGRAKRKQVVLPRQTQVKAYSTVRRSSSTTRQ